MTTVELERAAVLVQRPAVVWEGAHICVNDLTPQAGAERPPGASIRDLLPWFDVICTEHGELERVHLVALPSVYEVQWARTWAQHLAHRHAVEHHDGDVDRDGWA